MLGKERLFGDVIEWYGPESTLGVHGSLDGLADHLLDGAMHIVDDDVLASLMGQSDSLPGGFRVRHDGVVHQANAIGQTLFFQDRALP